MAASDATNRSRQFEPVATDTQGLFILPNLPANASYVLYPTLDSMKGRGAVTTRLVRTAANGSTTDLGRIAADPGFRLAGQVVFSDDKPMPPDAQLLIGREDGWDILFAPIDDQGRFDVPNLPAEPLLVAPYVEIEDYTLSPENTNLDPQQGALVIHPDRDMVDLVILLEPKPTG